jgi:pre-mRNA-splicing helicase BRR2
VLLLTGVRPVPLEIHIQGIDLTNMEARMQAMARPTYAALTNYVGESKPAILFVPTRKHARITAMEMLTFAAADGKPQRFLQVTPRFASPSCKQPP